MTSMRAVHHALLLAMVGCYSPSPPEGAPCTSSGTCPSPLVCDDGYCVRTPRDASPIDQADLDGPPVLEPDAMVDAMIDAPVSPLLTFDVGAYDFMVPPGCTQIHVRGWGGGGGGGGDGTGATNGTEGDDTIVAGFGRARGGKGGAHGNPGSTFLGGAGGTASGGTTNLTGETGGNGDSTQIGDTSGKGGDSPNGGAGGASITTANTNGAPGDPPGGGGSGAQGAFSPAAGGGAGAYAEATLPVNPGTKFTFIVGAGGPGGDGAQTGGGGADGRVTIQCM